jgi:hypothetical protein
LFNDIIRTIQEREMIWTRHVPHMREMVNMYRILVGKLKGGGHFENLGVDV